jgi:hypothetical protein
VFFEIVIWKFESSQVSQPVPEAEKLAGIVTERPANGGLLRNGSWSPGSGFLPYQGENAESLRPDTGIFPFSGDGDRRLGFDRHYVAGPAVVFPYFSLDRGGKSGVLFRNLKRVALSSAKTRAMLQRTLGEPRIGRIGRELVVH